ncbi:MAG: hypothetical protein LW832_10835 [Parachlamydia sp.]|jgi:hypothetical protein|nr:hypothetical protein [Parachlamydia sp.]
MAIRRTSDSLTRCDPGHYTNFYDPHKKVDMRIDTTAAAGKDTLQVTGEKLKQEALNRLRHQSKLVIFQTGFMRIGKIMFLAVAFPPYFLIVGIPKWFLTQVLPSFVNVSSQLLEKILAKVQKKIQTLTQKIAKTFLALQQTVLKLLLPVIQFYSRAQQFFKKLRQTGGEFLKRMKPGLPKNRGAALKNHLLKHARQLREMTKQWLITPFQLAARLPVLFNEWMGRLPQLGSRQVQKAQVKFLNFKLNWNEKIKMAHQFSHSFEKWVGKQFKNLSRASGLALKPVKELCLAVLPSLKKLYQHFSNKYKNLKRNFEDKKNKFLALLIKAQKKLNGLPTNYFSNLLLHYSKKPLLPLFLQKLLVSIANSAIVCNFLPHLYSYFKRCIALFLQLISKGIEFLSKGLTLFKSYKVQALHLALQAAHPLRKGSNFVTRGLQNGCHTFFLSIAMFIILLGWGGELLAKITNHLFRKISLSN